VGTDITFNKALDGSTYSELAEAYFGPGTTTLLPTLLNEANDYDSFVAGTFYAHGDTVYGTNPALVMGDLGTGVGFGYRDNAAIITPFAEVVVPGPPTFALSNVKSINGNPAFDPTFGSFSSTQTQPISDVSATPIVYDTADVTPIGMTCGLPSSQIVVTDAGTYKVLSSLQCDKTGVGVAPLEMWCDVDGTAVPNSATRIAVNQNIEQVMTVEWFLSLAAGDSVSVQCFSPTPAVIDLQALAVPAAAPVPAIPSIITTVLRIA
jgi:hypothetical protein